MGLLVRKLVFDGSSREGREIYTLVYDGLLMGTPPSKADLMPSLLRIIDELQRVSDLRFLTPEMERALQALAARQGQYWEQSEHDRTLRSGVQVVLLPDGDFQRLKSAFEAVTGRPAAQARQVDAAQQFLNAVPLVPVEEAITKTDVERSNFFPNEVDRTNRPFQEKNRS